MDSDEEFYGHAISNGEEPLRDEKTFEIDNSKPIRQDEPVNTQNKTHLTENPSITTLAIQEEMSPELVENVNENSDDTSSLSSTVSSSKSETATNVSRKSKTSTSSGPTADDQLPDRDSKSPLLLNENTESPPKNVISLPFDDSGYPPWPPIESWFQSLPTEDEPIGNQLSIDSKLINPHNRLHASELSIIDLWSDHSASECLHECVRAVALCSILHWEHNLRMAHAHANLANCYWYLHQLREQTHEHANVALLYLQQHKQQQGISDTSQISLHVHHLLSITCIYSKQFKTATKHLTKSIDNLPKCKSPNKPMWFVHLQISRAQIERCTGHNRNAIEILKKLLDWMDDQKQPRNLLYVDILHEIAHNYLLIEQNTENINYLTSAYNLLRDTKNHRRQLAEISSHLGEAYARSKHPENEVDMTQFHKEAIKILESEGHTAASIQYREQYIKDLVSVNQTEEAKHEWMLAKAKCVQFYGRYSTKMGDLYQLRAEIELKDPVNYGEALKNLQKALTIYSALLGVSNVKTVHCRDTIHDTNQLMKSHPTNL